MGIYENKRRVYVVPIQGLSLNYGFLTNVDANISAQLGHTDIGGALPPATVFGANSPKPARASKRFAAGVQSSYIDVGSVPTARSTGWSVGKARLRKGGTSQFTITVYVRISGIKYAWPMPLTKYNRIQGELAALGIVVATNEDSDLVFGASSPKPPRAYKVVVGEGGEDNLSNYVDPNATLPEGWKAVGSGVDPLQAV